MPVVTGLYTILLPIAVFAVLGPSRHLVVGSDSATAAVLASGLSGMAALGSGRYVGLAGLAALITAGLLLLARLIGVAKGLGHMSLPTLLVSLAVIVIVVGMRSVAKRIPAALLAVVGAIVVARVADLKGFGVQELGYSPRSVVLVRESRHHWRQVPVSPTARPKGGIDLYRRLAFSHVAAPVRAELDRYGITQLVGEDAYYESPADLLAPVGSG